MPTPAPTIASQTAITGRLAPSSGIDQDSPASPASITAGPAAIARRAPASPAAEVARAAAVQPSASTTVR